MRDAVGAQRTAPWLTPEKSSRRAFLSRAAAFSAASVLAGASTNCGAASVSDSTRKRVYRIGWLGAVTAPVELSERYVETRRALRDLGYVEGENLVIEFRHAVGSPERLPELATELVDLRVDLILAATSNPALAAKRATSSIPVIFHNLTDPVALGIVPSLSRPGANITGVAGRGPDMEAKRLEFFKEAVPAIDRVVVLYNSTDGGQKLRLQAAVTAAPSIGVRRIDPIPTNTPAELEAAMEAIVRQPPDGLADINPSSLYGTGLATAGSSPLFVKLLEVLVRHRIPHMCSGPEFVRAGGLMSMAQDALANARRIANLVDRILKGADPANVPVEMNSEFSLALNLSTARKIGLTFPEGVLRRSTEVIS